MVLYKSFCRSPKTYYGVTFNYGESKAVPGYIHDRRFVCLNTNYVESELQPKVEATAVKLEVAPKQAEVARPVEKEKPAKKSEPKKEEKKSEIKKAEAKKEDKPAAKKADEKKSESKDKTEKAKVDEKKAEVKKEEKKS